MELLASGVLQALTSDNEGRLRGLLEEDEVRMLARRLQDRQREAKSLARAATCAPLSILKRLFPAAPPPEPEAKGAKRSYQLRDGAGVGEISKEIFWMILSYWQTSTDDAVVLRDAVHLDHEDYVRRSERWADGGDY